MNFVTSCFRWLMGCLVMAGWYPLLIVASYLVPVARVHRPARFAFRLTMRALGMRIKVSGLEHLDVRRAYLYVGNHVNIFDPFAFVAAVPMWVVAVEKRPNFRLPIYGWLIERWGNIPIDRDSPTAALRTLMGLTQRLKAGESICLMPEGTRTRTGEMGEFKNGPFRVAIDAGVAVVPFVLKNMHQFNQTGSFRVRPCVVEVIFTPPIEANLYTKSTQQALATRVREQMQAALGGLSVADIAGEDAEDTNDNEDAEDTKDNEDANDSKDTKDSKPNKDNKDNKYTDDTEEANAAGAAGETKDALVKESGVPRADADSA
jgi:1-acyl-sn-glycerol-3-phosphate acyltransferase